MSGPLLPVVILAGGMATRLRPLTERIPKSLVEVNGEPFLAHQLRLLAARGLSAIVICAGHLGEQIRRYAGAGQRFGLTVRYSFDGPKLLGTAGAVRRALPLLGAEFFVLYGDSYLTCDYAAAQAAFHSSGRPALMTVYRNEGRYDASNVEFSAGRILRYDKRRRTPKMRHIDYGLGLFGRAAFERLPEDQPCDLASLYQALLARGELAGFEVPERFYEIGSPRGLKELRRLLSRQPAPAAKPCSMRGG